MRKVRLEHALTGKAYKFESFTECGKWLGIARETVNTAAIKGYKVTNKNTGARYKVFYA